MLFVSSYFLETVLTFCPLTWESFLNHVIAVAYRFVVELYVVFRTYFIELRESLLQHASSYFLIGPQVISVVTSFPFYTEFSFVYIFLVLVFQHYFMFGLLNFLERFSVLVIISLLLSQFHNTKFSSSFVFF